MFIITLDEKSAQPKYKQIISQVVEKINNGVLMAGDRLPSTRNLSQMLGVHKSTVALAYQELWSLGYIDLSPGACAVVRSRKKLIVKSPLEGKGLIEWSKISSIENNFDKIQSMDGNIIDFSTMNMEASMIPIESFRSSLNEIIKKQGNDLFKYGSTMGYNPLREYVAKHLESHGISVYPEEIMITNGTQHAIDLILRFAAAPGKSIVIEAPTYKEILPLIDYYKYKPVEIPMSPTGMDLDILEEKIITEKPSLIYTMPNFQNPTGITTTQAHRERLIGISEKNGIPIIEDGFQEEMKYFGKTVLPIKSMDKNKTVIYCSTFSKVLFPGVRVGWIAADRELILRLASLRYFSEIAPNMILQAGLYNFCTKGYYNQHLARLHRTYRKRMRTALDSLNKYVDKNLADWLEPSGGYLIWLKLKIIKKYPPNEYFESFGVVVSMGRRYFYSSNDGIYIRLSISALDELEIEEGIKRLGRAVDKLIMNND